MSLQHQYNFKCIKVTASCLWKTDVKFYFLLPWQNFQAKLRNLKVRSLLTVYFFQHCGELFDGKRSKVKNTVASETKLSVIVYNGLKLRCKGLRIKQKGPI